MSYFVFIEYCQSDKLSVKKLKKLNLEERDEKGNTPIHYLCQNSRINLNMVEQILLRSSVFENGLRREDEMMPIDILCENKSLTLEMLRLIYQRMPNIFENITEYRNNYFCYLCKNKNLSFELLQFICKKCPIIFRKKNGAILKNSIFHLCGNGNLTLKILQYMYSRATKFFNECSFTQLFSNKNLNLEILEFMYSKKPQFFNEGRMKFTYLFSNPNLNRNMLEFVYFKNSELFKSGMDELYLYGLLFHQNKGLLNFAIFTFNIFFPKFDANEEIFILDKNKYYKKYREGTLKINQYNFKHLAQSIKRNIILFILISKKMKIKFPKYLLFEISEKLLP